MSDNEIRARRDFLKLGGLGLAVSAAAAATLDVQKAAAQSAPTSMLRTVLNRGKTLGTANRGDIKAEELQDLMAGGQELATLEGSLGGTV